MTNDTDLDASTSDKVVQESSLHCTFSALTRSYTMPSKMHLGVKKGYRNYYCTDCQLASL